MLTGKLTRSGMSLGKAVRQLYAEGQTDYSIEPLVCTDQDGNPLGRIQDGAGVIFCCRRGEREVELTEAFTDPGFSYFPRPSLPNIDFSILTLYHEKFKDLPVAFAPSHLEDTLASIVSAAGFCQLHVSESEKFAHVTFFFNGGSNQKFEGETDLRVPSPRGIPFEQVPELSLPQLTAEVINGIKRDYDFIVTNFANGDVIGHTSNDAAKLKCATILDHHLGHVIEAALTNDYVLMITADHGNLELMRKQDGSPHVSHTSNRVPFAAIDPRQLTGPNPLDGCLADVAPTVLSALHLAKPKTMTGCNLLPEHEWGGRRHVLLVILDGWGIGRKDETNPIFLARTPVWDRLWCKYPHSTLQASGEAVGLQPGKAGNSEAGHLNLGAGRLVLQDDVRLDMAIKDGTFESNEVFIRIMQRLRREGKPLHLIGLLSEKSSHGSMDYVLALVQMAKKQGIQHAYIHLIFDGRSTEPGSAPLMLEKLEARLEQVGLGEVVTGIGRGIALDRDGNYDKIRRAYDALVSGVGRPYILE